KPRRSSRTRTRDRIGSVKNPRLEPSPRTVVQKEGSERGFSTSVLNELSLRDPHAAKNHRSSDHDAYRKRLIQHQRSQRNGEQRVDVGVKRNDRERQV